MDSSGMDTLLSQLAGGQSIDAASMLRGLVEHADPRIRAVAQCMEQNRLAAEVVEAPSQDSLVVEAGDVTTVESDVRIAAARRTVRALRRQVALLQGALQALSDALGACSSCWGEDDACPQCAGSGSPGFRVPEPDSFRELVMPAVERLEQVQSIQGVLRRRRSGRSQIAPGGAASAKE